MHFLRNINWRLILPIAAVILFTVSCAAVAQVTQTAPAGAAGTTPTTTQTQPAPAAGAPKPPAQQPGYVDTPDSVKKLVQDSQAATKKYADGGMGVHFSENMTLSFKNMTLLSEADGDLMPGKVKFSGELRLPRELVPCGCPNPLLYDAVVTDGMFYLKPHGGHWKSHSVEDISNLDDNVEKMDFLQFVTTWKNLGIETQNGNRVYHVRLDFDAKAVYGKLEQHLKANADKATRDGMDKLKTSVLEDDIWIGADNLLIYQETSHIRNDDLYISGDDMYMFWNWGEKVNITAPM